MSYNQDYNKQLIYELDCIYSNNSDSDNNYMCVGATHGKGHQTEPRGEVH